MTTRHLVLALLLAAVPLRAQVASPASPASPAEAGHGAAATGCPAHDPADIITPHITDSHCIEVPGFPKFWEVQIGRAHV